MTEPKLNLITASSAAEPPDRFDLASPRLSQNFTESAGVKKLLRTVLVHKPNAQDFVRVHPGEEYRADFPIIELKEEREMDEHKENRPVQRPVWVTVRKTKELSGLGTTKIYELLAKRQLRSIKVGRRRLVEYSSIENLINTSAETA